MYCFGNKYDSLVHFHISISNLQLLMAKCKFIKYDKLTQFSDKEP